MDVAKLQGRWTMVSMEVEGRALDEPARGFELAIKGDEWIVTSPKEPDRVLRMTVRIDASKSPKAIDMAADEGGREQVTPGIYKLDGDTLTLRRATMAGDVARPREFSTSPEEGMLIVWQRAMK